MATSKSGRDLAHARRRQLPELVTWLPAECRLGFVSMSGDGRRLACAVLHQEPDIWLVSHFDAAR